MCIQDLENAVMVYVNNEFCKKLDDWRKWAVPLAIGAYIPSLKKKYEENLDILKSANLVSDTGDILIDSVYERLHKISIDMGNIICQVPMIGQVTFSTADVNAMYNIIKNQSATNVSAAPQQPANSQSFIQHTY